MLLNIWDWTKFFRDCGIFVKFYLKYNRIKEGLSLLHASITDLIFYGGRICNWHGKFLCEKCYTKEFIDKAQAEIDSFAQHVNCRCTTTTGYE